MNHRLLSLLKHAPEGFQYRAHLEQRDVRRRPFALLAASREQAEAALEPFGSHLAGIIVTCAVELTWQSCTPLLFHLTVPPPFENHLAALLHTHLQLLEQLQHSADCSAGQALQLERAHDEARRNKHEFGLVKTSLVQELSERRQVEQALRESEAHYRLLTENVSDVVWKLDATYHFTYISPSDQRLRGYSADEVIGQHVFELFDDAGIADITRLAQQRQAAEQNGVRSGTVTFEARQRCKDGRWLWAEICSTPEYASDGCIVGFHGISRNITERKAHEQDQLKMEKLESLGVLAGGIAHDFNNILTGIMGNISFAQMLLEPGHKSYKPLMEAEKASLRASELAHQLLTFARGGTPVKKSVSVMDLVHETASLVLHGSNVKSCIRIPDGIHAVEADEGQLSQVFHNIIINATQAMPGGGQITITAANESLTDTATLPLPAGTYVRLTFTDQGCGIADDVLQKIFDPYFTTKSSGNGLGLASALSIITRHGGHINVSSRVGSGTTFTIRLPSNGQPYTGHRIEPALPAGGSARAGHILVMDDEQMIREMTAEMLEYMGYQVTTCQEGGEAIERYEAALAAGAPFSALVMDLTIPGGMGGKEAAGHILALDPQARLIVSSGYSNDPIMADFASYGFAGAIAKPYSIQNFERILGAVLAKTEQ